METKEILCGTIEELTEYFENTISKYYDFAKEIDDINKIEKTKFPICMECKDSTIKKQLQFLYDSKQYTNIIYYLGFLYPEEKNEVQMVMIKEYVHIKVPLNLDFSTSDV